jgi:primosomal protein N' (replication factor Y)
MQLEAAPPPNHRATFVKVALPIPIDTLFTYEVPEEFRDRVSIGTRVEVPLGRRIVGGVVFELAAESDYHPTRKIQNTTDVHLNPQLIALARWIASYYGCSRGEAAQACLPPRVTRARRSARLAGKLRLAISVKSVDELERPFSRAAKQLALLKTLFHVGGEAPMETVCGEWGYSRAVVKGLLGKNAVRVVQESRTSPLAGIDREVKELSGPQKTALEALASALASNAFSPFLLHGVTGSGKTEIYLRAIRDVIASGGGCIVLVPEIGLIPQATARYRRVFGDKLAIIHSRLTPVQRLEMWRKIESGECRVVLGPRSAVFSPVRNLRMIVVDEEQDDSYKQEDKPRYHARSVALMRGKFENLTVLLGSATPSAESFFHAGRKRYRRLELPERVGGGAMPRIHLVDMRRESTDGGFFSKTLLDYLEANIKAGGQSIIFLNKRGHARFIQCSACGWVAGCNNCDISLTYHRVGRRARCHFCGFAKTAPSRCETCGSSRLFFSGVGTQRVELDLQGFYPGIGILRMDADTTSGKRGHQRILEEFSTGRYPILIGTQMVTKGHHFPGVSLVGVLHAEEGLNFPDFRSAEKTFQILEQVSGRSGREGKVGEVVIQTFMPDHYLFSFLKRHDYSGFMHEELGIRKQLNYPPFARILLASFSSTNKAALDRVVAGWVREVRRMAAKGKAELLGPSPPLVPRIRNRHREHVLIKGDFTAADKKEMLAVFSKVAAAAPNGRSVELRWDVDPESFF